MSSTLPGLKPDYRVCELAKRCFCFESGAVVICEQRRPDAGDYVLIESPDLQDVGICHPSYIELPDGTPLIGGWDYVQGVITAIL